MLVHGMGRRSPAPSFVFTCENRGDRRKYGTAIIETMYELTTDAGKRRLTVSFDGKLDADAASEAADEVLAAAEELGEGFQMINDIRQFKPLSQDAVSEIERAKKGIAEAGVSAVARVTGESVLGSMQFNRVGDQAYDLFEVETMEDAHDVLDDQ